MAFKTPYRIVDNFLSDKDFLNLKSIFTNSEFDWNYHFHSSTTAGVVEKYDTYLTHEFFPQKHSRDSKSFGMMDKYYLQVNKLIEKLDVVELMNIRANLNLFLEEPYITEPHVDHNEKGYKTCVFYINTNNGKTRLTNIGLDVHCKENRALIFDSDVEHAAIIQTDEKERIVININFKPKEGSIFDF